MAPIRLIKADKPDAIALKQNYRIRKLKKFIDFSFNFMDSILELIF